MSRKSVYFFFLLGRKINVVLNNVTGCDNLFGISTASNHICRRCLK